MYTDYQAFEDTGAAPDYLLIGAYIDYAIGFTPSKPAVRAQPEPLPEVEHDAPRKHLKGNGRRTYKSVYVGVTTHNQRFVAPGSGGSVHEYTPEGARLAAIDRARAMERDYLERRDGEQEPLY